MRKNSNRIIPIFIPFFGCSRICVYCNQSAITKVSSSKDIIASAKEQLALWEGRLSSATEVAFYGGTFTNLPADVRWQLYDIAKPYAIRLSTAPDAIHDEFLKEIDEYHIKTVELGVQSLDDTVLSANNRQYSSEDVFCAFDRLHSKNVATVIQLMCGMYTESLDSFISTARRCENIHAQYARIYPTMVLRNTALEQLYYDTKYTPFTPQETVLRTAWLYISLIANGCNVIRIGLPSEIEQSDIVAGFWHPALGDIVKTLVVAVYATIFGGLPAFIGADGGYKRFLKLNFGLQHSVEVATIGEVCITLKEHFSANSEWFTSKQVADIAAKLCG